MSTQEVKKAKRRKNKVATGKYSSATIPQTNEVTEVVTEENGDAEVRSYGRDSLHMIYAFLMIISKSCNAFTSKEVEQIRFCD